MSGSSEKEEAFHTRMADQPEAGSKKGSAVRVVLGKARLAGTGHIAESHRQRQCDFRGPLALAIQSDVAPAARHRDHIATLHGTVRGGSRSRHIEGQQRGLGLVNDEGQGRGRLNRNGQRVVVDRW